MGRRAESDRDSSSELEEISADDFRREKANKGPNGGPGNKGAWMGYTNPPYSLYSFAWAQAVQNRPLMANASAVEEDVEGESDGDVEKEEGEIEEGEIGDGVAAAALPSEAQVVDLASPEANEAEPRIEGTEEEVEEQEEDGDFDSRVAEILEDLELVTADEALKSFEDCCAKLKRSFESLKPPLFPEDGSLNSLRDTIVQQAFTGISSVISVVSSRSLPTREKNKNMIVKLLIHIKNQYSDMLTPDQLTELDKNANLLYFEDPNDGKHQGVMDNKCGMTIMEKPMLRSGPMNPYSTHLDKDTGCRNKNSGLLIDLHADYDESSLPSPTRDNAPPLPVLKPISSGGAKDAPARPLAPLDIQPHSAQLQTYVTDALKAVSSYQQKFGQHSLATDLPSPTPSGDGNNNNEDTPGEVSSSFNPGRYPPMTVVRQRPPAFLPSISRVDAPLVGPPQRVQQPEPLSMLPNLGLKPSSKSRDPRLRLVNSESSRTRSFDQNKNVPFSESSISKDGIAGGKPDSRKNKATDFALADEQMPKKLKNGIVNSAESSVPGRGGNWNEDRSSNSALPAGDVTNSHLAGSNRIQMARPLNGDSVPNRSMTNNASDSLTNAGKLHPEPVGLQHTPQSVGPPNILSAVVPQRPQMVGFPQIPQALGSAGMPQNVGLPNISQPVSSQTIQKNVGIPNMLQASGIPNISQAAGLPNMSQTSGLPNTPQTAGIPNMPQAAFLPNMPQAAFLPNMPQAASLPNMPQVAGLPNVPQTIGLQNRPQMVRPPSNPTLAGLNQMAQNFVLSHSQNGAIPRPVQTAAPRLPPDAAGQLQAPSFTGLSQGLTSAMAQVPQNSAPPISLPSFLKDMASNPSLLRQILQLDQQRQAAEAQTKAASASSPQMPNSVMGNTTPGSFSSPSLPAQSLLAAQPNAASFAQVSSQTNASPPIPAPLKSQNVSGVMRMKPRDPRRALHSSMAMKIDSPSEPLKATEIAKPESQKSNDLLTVRSQGEQAQPISSQLLQPTVPANIAPGVKDAATSHLISDPSPISSKSTLDTRLLQSGEDSGSSVTTVGSNTLNSTAETSRPSSEIAAVSMPVMNSPWGDVDHLLDGYDDEQKEAIQKERARRIMEQHKMFAARKLCLVLDLDHTLLNSAKFVEIDPVHEEILRKKEEQDRERAQRHIFRFQHMGMWTKLRPGIWNFLEKASKLFELHLYTMGNNAYATEMAKVLDPTGALFAGRVISRGDDGDPFDGDDRAPKSKDLDGVLGMESAVVIIDDSVRVWPHNKHNLIVVERYIYFPCSRRQFGLPGPALLEIDHDERPEDGTLSSSLAVIERIHQNFFAHAALDEADVRTILAEEQRRILAGCRIVFSRIFPVGEANPHLHPLWQTAEQFGAVCTNQIDEQVTHVVAHALGTDKVNWALSRGKFVVHPGWVEASALLYRRASEHDFAVKP